MLGVLLTLSWPALAHDTTSTAPPAAPGQLTGTVIHAGMVELDWSDVAEATAYRIQAWDGSDFFDVPSRNLVTGNKVEVLFYGSLAILTGLPHEGVYYFRVQAVNAAGASEWSEILFLSNISPDLVDEPLPTFAPTPTPEPTPATQPAAEAPSVPRNLAGHASCGSITLNWNVPADGAVTGYRILRRRPSEGERTLLVYVADTGSSATTYTDIDVEPGVEYVYRVKAVNRGEVGPQSNYHNVKMPPSALTPAGTPGNLCATVVGDVIRLAWDAPADIAVTGYQVLRRRPPAGEKRLRVYEENTGSAATTYMDRNVESGIRYVYRVKAVSAEGVGSQSNYVNINVPRQPATPEPAPALTADFHATPESHDGQTPFTFELRFSEEIESLQYRTVRYLALQLSGGLVVEARRPAPPSRVRWEITIDPDGSGDVTVVLPVTGACDDLEAICTGDGRELSNRTELTVAGPAVQDATAPAQQQRPNFRATGAPTISGTAQVGHALTADVSAISDTDGLTGVSFTYQWLTDNTPIDGAAGTSYTLTEAEEGKIVRVKASFADDAGNAEAMESAPTAAVAPVEALTAAFQDAPAHHDGAEPFTVRIAFSEPVATSHQPSMFSSLELTGGQFISAGRVDGRHDLWEIIVRPAHNHPGEIHIMLPTGLPCDLPGSICTEDGKRLSIWIELTVPSLPVYLTFDDGPHSTHTPQILDILARYGARSTFFVIGVHAAQHPDLIERMVAEGHTVGNHTYRHERLNDLSLESFNDTVGRTQELLGDHGAACLRAPFGAANALTEERARALGLELIPWTVNTYDWSNSGVDSIVDHILTGVSPEAIILMHDGVGNGQIVQALDTALRRLSALGVRFEPVCR